LAGQPEAAIVPFVNGSLGYLAQAPFPANFRIADQPLTIPVRDLFRCYSPTTHNRITLHRRSKGIEVSVRS
jgi:hypothetical protein